MAPQVEEFELNKNVFIVHGRSESDRDELADMLRKYGCTPRILQLEPKRGGPLIDEFEKLAKKCTFAFVLLTPEDSFSKPDEAAEQAMRARQNVIFEMGWFFNALGRHRTRLLYKKNVELPSDVTGITYIRYEEAVKEKEEAIRRALVEGGLLDPNLQDKDA